MNKYQKALDELKELPFFDTNDDTDKTLKDCMTKEVETLQELIDSYTEDTDYCAEVIHDKNERIKELEDRLVEEDEIHKEALKEMAECIERYEKALDKAIVTLIDIDIGIYNMTENGWKEWLLKDE